MRTILGVLMALILVGAVAGHAEAVDLDYPYVWKISIGDDNHLWINVYPNFTTAHGCQERWYARSKHSLDSEITKAMLQMAMASLLSHTPVHVWTTGCTGTGSSGYPVLIQLQLQRP